MSKRVVNIQAATEDRAISIEEDANKLVLVFDPNGTGREHTLKIIREHDSWIMTITLNGTNHSAEVTITDTRLRIEAIRTNELLLLKDAMPVEPFKNPCTCHMCNVVFDRFVDDGVVPLCEKCRTKLTGQKRPIYECGKCRYPGPENKFLGTELSCADGIRRCPSCGSTNVNVRAE